MKGVAYCVKRIATKLGKYYKLPNPGLRAFLHRNEVGQPEVYETPLFKGKTFQEVLDGFKVDDSIDGLLEFELEMKAKVGPMSIMKPFHEVEDKVVEYYKNIDKPQEPILPEAIQATVDEWRPIHGIRPMSRDNTIKEMRLGTNSGAPFFTKRSNVVDKPVDDYPPVATKGWRGQEGGPSEDDVKQRVVWMFPFDVNVKELSVYKPIIKGLQRHNLVPALVSMDAVDARVTALFDSKPKEDVVIATDFSGYDQTFGPVAQAAAREIWEKLGVPKKWLEEVYPIKFNIPLVCTEDIMYTGPHGMASGSGGTNTDECAEHRALQHQAAIKAGQKLNPNSMAYGDDGLIHFKGITVDDVISAYTSAGHVMNVDKQYVSETRTTFLRRFYHTDYRPDGLMRGVYSAYRALGRLRMQERYFDPEKWSAKMLILRSLSILENTKWHPQFEELVDYVLSGDKFKLGLAIPGFFTSKNLTTLAKEARRNLGDDFLGYVKSMMSDDTSAGIDSWRVVKYLRSKIK